MPRWCNRRDLCRALQSLSHCPLLENGFENGMEVALQLWDHICDWELEHSDQTPIDSLQDACDRIANFEEDHRTYMRDPPTLLWLPQNNYFEGAARRRNIEVAEYEQAMPNCYDPDHPTDLLDYLKAFPELVDGPAVTAFWLILPTPHQRVDLYHHLCHWLFD